MVCMGQSLVGSRRGDEAGLAKAMESMSRRCALIQRKVWVQKHWGNTTGSPQRVMSTANVKEQKAEEKRGVWKSCIAPPYP